METKILIYTTDGCAVCQSMKSALEGLGIGYTEIRLTNGMTVLPDVRRVPTLAMEKDGRRTTVCAGWPGNEKTFERILNSFGIPMTGAGQ
ncbi:MAG: glutaredoxin domain-containing protein [Candidatus Aminicenantes bacterium]|jgi:glutaredoxin